MIKLTKKKSHILKTRGENENFMSIEKIYEQLKKEKPSLEVKQNEPMSKHTTFRVGGNADIFIKIKTMEELKYIVKYAKENDISLTILGNGSNVLVKDNGIRGITITLCGLNKIEIHEENNKTILTVGAGVKLGTLNAFCLKNEIEGIEFASGIPGTIGGAIRMNAGAYGKEMKEIVKQVTYINENNETKTIDGELADFSYRHSRFKESQEIITKAKLELKKGKMEEIKTKINELKEKRKEKQPIELPSAGSIFKRGTNYISAQLIDEAGLKGHSVGGAQISKKHAGFIVNTGNATAKDILELIDYVIKTVYKKFGKILELEIEILGE